ncbi:MAG: hypothetical protein SFY66_18505 [Oculatellaceae cyanobacterium bins.114]|nr:hypothetical protein [Oculatellaceae cyanobacterium bins.114]
MAHPTDDNLIRLMLQPPKTGDDDPLVKASKVVQRKLDRWRASPGYRVDAAEVVPTQSQLVISFEVSE